VRRDPVPDRPQDVLRRADRLGFSEGADWSEAGIGTSANSEALVTGPPVQLVSAEHLVRTHHEWACATAPITDSLRGSCWACSTSPDRWIPQCGHAADGAVRGAGGGVAAGNGRRRCLLGEPRSQCGRPRGLSAGLVRRGSCWAQRATGRRLNRTFSKRAKLVPLIPCPGREARSRPPYRALRCQDIDNSSSLEDIGHDVA
jgi:hypothetical protein